MNRQKGSSPTFTPTYSRNDAPSLSRDPIMVKKFMNPSKIKQRILDESRTTLNSRFPCTKNPNPHYKTPSSHLSPSSHFSYPNPNTLKTPTHPSPQPYPNSRPPAPHLPQNIVNNLNTQNTTNYSKPNTNLPYKNEYFDTDSIENHTKNHNEIFIENNPIRSINQTFNSCRITRSISNCSHGDSDREASVGLRESYGNKNLEPNGAGPGGLDDPRKSETKKCEVSGGQDLEGDMDGDGSGFGKSVDFGCGGALYVDESPGTKVNNNCSTYRHRHNYYDSLEVNQEFTFEQKFEFDMLNLPISFQGDGKSLLVDHKGNFIGDSL
jgi:hypothetical protein